MTKARSLRFAPLVLAVATFTAGLVALPNTAGADRVRIRVGGDLHISGRAHVRVGGPRVVVRPRVRRYHRYPRYRPYVYVRPAPLFPYWAPYWHYRYAPPPPPCYAECAPVPSYYTGPAYAPQPAVVVTAAPRQPLPRFSIGVFAGAVGVEDSEEAGTDIGLLGRFRLTRHLLLEGEIAKSELDEGVRVDRRVGGALLYDFAPWSSLSPYILGGGGVGQTDIGDGTITAEHVYGELGIGLKLALGRHFSLFGDLRGGMRAGDEDESDAGPVVFAPRPGATPGSSIEDDERFTRGRIGLLLSF